VAGVALGVGGAGSAQAAMVTPSDLDATHSFMTITMDNTVTTLTLSDDAPGVRRIHEDGAALTLSGAAGAGGCTQAVAGGDIVCTGTQFAKWTVTNLGGSVTPAVRDVIVAKSLAHGDTSGFFDLPLDVSAGQGLMEAWLPDGTLPSKFTGSETVTAPGTTADIVHVGSGGTSSGSAMGGGADLVIGSTGSVNMVGGNGDDTLIGSTANDTLDGGAGSDLVRGGLGADSLSPGAGFGVDVLSYDDLTRPAGLTMSFAPGAAMTGPDGDSVAAGFDVLEGTPLADNLSLASGGGGLRGAEGDDTLTGSPGIDSFDGGDGTDVIRALDGNAETVDCGAGLDVDFSVDASDTLTGCEGPQAPAAPAAPAGADPAAAAPAAAIARPPVPTAAATRPSSAQIAALPLIGAGLSAKFGLSGASTTVATLTAKKLPAGATVTVACRGKKCAFASKSQTVKKATATLPLAALFKKRKLSAGTTIVVRIAASGVRGRSFTYTTRKAKQPKRAAGCTAPDGSTATC
jgi:Ca2+-binding RTX toxin-like protein